MNATCPIDPGFARILWQTPAYREKFAAHPPVTAADYFLAQSRLVSVNGVASSGKTSIIRELKKRGCRTVDEEAVVYFEEVRRRQGLGIPELFTSRASAQATQREIMRRMFANEAALDLGARVFLDQGIGGSMMYAAHWGMEAEEFVPRAFAVRYGAVFLLDMLPYADEPHRIEKKIGLDIAAIDRDRARNDAFCEAFYRGMGYTPIRIPVMSIADRTDFILNHPEVRMLGRD